MLTLLFQAFDFAIKLLDLTYFFAPPLPEELCFGTNHVVPQSGETLLLTLLALGLSATTKDSKQTTRRGATKKTGKTPTKKKNNINHKNNAKINKSDNRYITNINQNKEPQNSDLV